MLHKVWLLCDSWKVSPHISTHVINGGRNSYSPQPAFTSPVAYSRLISVVGATKTWYIDREHRMPSLLLSHTPCIGITHYAGNTYPIPQWRALGNVFTAYRLANGKATANHWYIFTHIVTFDGTVLDLINWGLLTPYGDTELGIQRLKYPNVLRIFILSHNRVYLDQHIF